MHGMRVTHVHWAAVRWRQPLRHAALHLLRTRLLPFGGQLDH